MNESRLAELRRAKGWTQERLAGESGITVSAIQRLEAGKDASLDTISRIAKALDVAVGELFTRVESDRLEPAVEGLGQRVTQEQERRDSNSQEIIMVYGDPAGLRHRHPGHRGPLRVAHLAHYSRVLVRKSAVARSRIPSGHRSATG